MVERSNLSVIKSKRERKAAQVRDSALSIFSISANFHLDWGLKRLGQHP